MAKKEWAGWMKMDNILNGKGNMPIRQRWRGKDQELGQSQC